MVDFEKLDIHFSVLTELEKKIGDVFKKAKITNNKTQNLAEKTILEVELKELVDEHEKLTSLVFEVFINNGYFDRTGIKNIVKTQLRFLKSLETMTFIQRTSETIVGVYDDIKNN